MQVSSTNTFDPYHIWLGIPPQEQPPTYYRLLGIPPFEANGDVISSAADRQMSHLRTFQTGRFSEQSQKLLNEVAAAKVRLLRPATKAAYDAELRKKSVARLAVNQGSGLRIKNDAPEPESASAMGQRGPVRAEVARDAKTLSAAQRATPTVVPLLSATTHDATSFDFSSVDLSSTAAPRSRRRMRSKASALGVAWIAILGGVGMLAGILMWKRTQSSMPIQDIAQVRPNVAADKASVVPAKSTTAPPIEEIVALPKDSKPAGGDDAQLGASLTPSPAQLSSPQATSMGGTGNPITPQAPVFAPPEHEATESVESTETPVFASSEPETALENPGPVDSQPSETVPAQTKRRPAPSAEAQDAVRKQLETVYDLQHLKTPREKLKLANELMEVAAKSTEAAESYVLLQEAADLAGKGGDATLILQAIDVLDRQFQFDAVEAKEKAILQFAESATTSERVRSLMAIAKRVIEQAMEEKRFETALLLANAVSRACQRSPGKEFRKAATELRNAVRTMSEEQAALITASETLRSDSADGSANMVLGRWFCFVAEDWKQGLPHLAKAGDEDLKQLAERELNSSTASPDYQLQLADAWWELANNRKGEERDALMLHAGYWYDQFLKTPQSGLTKLKVGKRLDELVEVRERFGAFQAKHLLRPSYHTRDALWTDGAP